MSDDKYVLKTRIEKSFSYKSPEAHQIVRYEEIRQFAKEFALLLCETCPPSRELSLAITNLEQVVMWANKSIYMAGET